MEDVFEETKEDIIDATLSFGTNYEWGWVM